MKNKRKILFIASSLSVAISLLICAVVTGREDLIEICDDPTPLYSEITREGQKIIESNTDINVIPDKYNTGCIIGNMITVDKEGTYNGIQYTPYGSGGGTLRLDFWKTNKKLDDDVYIENCDFSSKNFVISYTDKLSTTKRVHFKNCKFASFKTDSSLNLEMSFEYCEMIHFAGKKSTFDHCKFGFGAMGDAVNPGNDCSFKNCYIADIARSGDVKETNHVDGFQIFNEVSNVSFENCRFEIPYIPFTKSLGSMNCPVTFTLRSGNASNISFSNCIVNGGHWYGVQLVSSPGYTFSNITFNNVYVGHNSKSIYNDESGLGVGKSLLSMDNLYVSSVWKDGGKIHVSVSNDTNDPRKLLVMTPLGEEIFDIPACPRGIDIPVDSMTFNDFPFDIDISVKEADWVICYDITDDADLQLRFVNWSGKPVVLEDGEELLESVGEIAEMPMFSFSAKSMTAAPLLTSESIPEEDVTAAVESVAEESVAESYSGKCGDNVSYVYDNGLLTLSGSGATYNYHSGKMPPWDAYKTDIGYVVVGEGISKLGDALFLNCSSVTDVALPSTLTSIGINTFNKCKKLTAVSIPETVTKIDKYAFGGSGVNTVHFMGSETAWNNIAFGEKNGLTGSGVAVDFAVTEEAAEPVQEETDALPSGQCGDNAYYELQSDGTLVITGTGSTYAYHSGNKTPWIEYESMITKAVIGDGITNINNQLFAEHTALTEVYIPDSVERIGKNAFMKDKALTTVHIGSGVTVIEEYAFGGDSQLTQIYYSGSEESWNSISIGDHNGLSDKEIVFE